jgi:hypothetical protein
MLIGKRFRALKAINCDLFSKNDDTEEVTEWKNTSLYLLI